MTFKKEMCSLIFQVILICLHMRFGHDMCVLVGFTTVEKLSIKSPAALMIIMIIGTCPGSHDPSSCKDNVL